MRTHVISAVGVLGATAMFLGAMLVTNPVLKTRNFIPRLFLGNIPEDSLVSNLYENSLTQEASHGEHPLPSFAKLAEVWAKKPKQERMYFMGNSQMHAIVLAPGEYRVSAAEMTYLDMVFAHYEREPGNNMLFYRISAPNITFTEALWYLHYLMVIPGLRPNRIVLQLTYQSFRLDGVRGGMLELLSDSRFRSEITSAAQSEKPYGPTFQQAIGRYDTSVNEQKATGVRAPDAGAQLARESQTGVTQSLGFGNYLESAVRERLEHVPAWRERGDIKVSFMEALYLLRVFLLKITPTTKRAISQASLATSLGALKEIVNLCHQQDIELILLNAPTNPSTPLYLTEYDKLSYENMIRDLANTNQLHLYDFEASIPKECWGVWIDGPDPIHFGREGHRRMAKLVIDSGVIHERN